LVQAENSPELGPGPAGELLAGIVAARRPNATIIAAVMIPNSFFMFPPSNWFKTNALTF